RAGSHHGRQGRASQARHRRSLQHHPGRQRDRRGPGPRPASPSRRSLRHRRGPPGRAPRVPARAGGILGSPPGVAVSRAIVIHGHFYQPPRENPWLEAVEVQDSAAPFHDWNARITAECYAPNTAARRVDEANRILAIVDNFERMSFNVGPTLFAWLEREAPAVARAIVDADRASAAAPGGQANSIAQLFTHPSQ